jgi:hypothetical protein
MIRKVVMLMSVIATRLGHADTPITGRHFSRSAARFPISGKGENKVISINKTV